VAAAALKLQNLALFQAGERLPIADPGVRHGRNNRRTFASCCPAPDARNSTDLLNQ
jgi:hypothetical protein